MTELSVEYRKTADLLPYARNARKHPESQVKQIAASIQEFGFTTPILIDEKNMLIAGHCRLLAAEKLGMENVPTIKLAHLSEIQARAYNIADNQLTLVSEWDMDLLSLEIQELADDDFDLDLLGFDNLDDLLEKDDFEFTGKEKNDEENEKFEIKISLQSYEEKEELFLELRDRGFEVKS